MMIGAKVGHFQVLEKIGEGAMGEVFKARDTRLNRSVALKFLATNLCADPVASERFLREARAIAALNHPHICTIFDIGEHEGRPFFAMEHLAGKTLRDVAKAGPLDIPTLQKIAFQLADALQAAHAENILHRDLKSANVFFDRQGNTKLLDFGLAKTIKPSAADAGTTLALDSAADAAEMARLAETIQGTITHAGSTLGTPFYMSPEQLRGEELDQRSDLFSFGLILYELATGKRAFGGRTLPVIFDQILNHVPAPVADLRPDIPPNLAAVTRRLMQKNRNDRYGSATEVMEALMLPVALKNGTEVQGEAAVSLPSLGKNRSPLWVGPMMAGSILIGYSLAKSTKHMSESGLGWHWQQGLWPGIVGVILFLLTPLVWWIAGRRLGPSSAGESLRITYLKDQSTHRNWKLWYLTILAFALVTTFIVARIAWDMWGPDPTGDNPRTFSMLMIYNFFLLWFVVLRGRRWRDHPPTRKQMTIEVQGSYARILADISQVIAKLDARVTGMDLKRGLIRVKTSAGLRSWGERMSFSVQEIAAGNYEVSLVSECAFPLVFSDGGKNKANLQLVVDKLA